MDKKREEDVDYAAAYRQFMNLRVKRARIFHLPNNQAKTCQTTKLLLNSLFVSEKSCTFAQKYYCMAEHFNYLHPMPLLSMVFN